MGKAQGQVCNDGRGLIAKVICIRRQLGKHEIVSISDHFNNIGKVSRDKLPHLS